MIDVGSGGIRTGLRPSGPGARLHDVRWDRTGTALYYREGQAIKRFDIATSAIIQIYEPADAKVSIFSGFDVSPVDGSLAMLLSDESGGCLVRIVPDSGPPVDRYRLDGEECLGVTWTEDGSTILAATMPGRTPALWRLDRVAGDPVHLPITADALWDLALSPDEIRAAVLGGQPDAERCDVKRDRSVIRVAFLLHEA